MLPGGGDNAVIKIGVFAALAYDVTSANMSSPQTYELNSSQRAPTLMKWLTLNTVEALVWGLAASAADGSPYPFIGAALGTASMFCKYQYAVRAGRASGLPDMENFATGSYDLGQPAARATPW